MEDWDLQAIVNGCRKPTSTPFFSLLEDDDFSSFYPQFYETSTISLHEFQGSVGNQIIPHPFSLMASISCPGDQFREPEKPRQKNQTKATKQKPSKKSKQNRVVKHVREDGVCLDSWAWRKYGQKPIKGSPYPRSYYRCSSSKGCPARKQVERTHFDPHTFTVTYTADHNHSEPTRRNALAGSTRKKFPTSENTDHELNIGEVSNLDMALSPSSAASTASGEEEPVVANDELQINEPFETLSDDDAYSGLEELLYG